MTLSYFTFSNLHDLLLPQNHLKNLGALLSPFSSFQWSFLVFILTFGFLLLILWFSFNTFILFFYFICFKLFISCLLFSSVPYFSVGNYFITSDLLHCILPLYMVTHVFPVYCSTLAKLLSMTGSQKLSNLINHSSSTL